jgi:uncharacterized surface protein with fasciclin (FAS1) repeats
MKNLSLILTVAASLLICTTALAQGEKKEVAAAPGGASDNLVAQLVRKGFNTFFAAVDKAEYVDKLGSGTYTILAPNDVAFRDLPKQELDALLADKDKLIALLSRHIIEGKVSAAELKSGNVKTLAGTTVTARVVDGKLKIGTARIVKQDVPASNGVIHGIDAFLGK